MPYTVALPDGRLIEFPDEVSKEDAARHIRKKFPEFRPVPTAGGQVKEFFKGLAPGAINLTETAVKGAASVLPDDIEKSLVDRYSKVAEEGRKPFEAGYGYEDSVGRKFGEAVGSTVPFFALGPLGAAGKVGAALLGTAAGAGEARGRAEQGAASDEQKAISTALGAAVGTTEVLPVFRFIEKLGAPVAKGIIDYVKRAAATGGAEGAQEAASQVAQNLIEKGVYNPQQEVFLDVGEAAGYGAGTGALIQALTDLALGRKAKSAGVVATGEESPIEKARREQAEKEAAKSIQKANTESAIKSIDELVSIASKPNGPGELIVYREKLKQLPKTEATQAAIKEADELIKRINVEQINRIRGTKEQPESAFDLPQQELFDDKLYLPQQEQENVPEPTVRTIDERQLELPFTGEQGQLPLFPELGYDTQTAPVDYTKYTGPEDAVTITDGMLDSAGVGPRAAIRKRLLGRRLDRTSDLEFVFSELEAYANNNAYIKEEQRPALTSFLDNLRFLRAKTPELPKLRPPRAKNATNQATDTGATAELVEQANLPGIREDLGVDAGTAGVPANQPASGGTNVPQANAGRADGNEGIGELALTPGEPTNLSVEELQTRLDNIYNAIKTKEAEQQSLLQSNGRIPAAKSKKRIKFDELGEEIQQMKAEFLKLDDLVKARKTAPVAPEATTSEPVDTRVEIPEFIAQDVNSLKEERGLVREKLSGLLATRKNLFTPGGALKPGNEDTLRSLDTQVDNYRQQIKAINGMIRSRTGSEETTEAEAATETLAPTDWWKSNKDTLDRETVGELKQRIDQAVGAYNNPNSPPMRRKLSADYLVEVANDDDIKRAKPKAHKYALQALVGAIDRNDLSPHNRLLYDDLTKGVADDLSIPWGEMLFSKGTLTNYDLQQSKELDDLLRGASFTEAINIAVSKARNPYEAAIAGKVKRRFIDLYSKGVEFEFALTNPGNVMSSGALGVSSMNTAPLGEATKIKVTLNGFTGDNRTLDYETLLHELVHAVTQAQVKFAPQGSAALQLKKLHEEIVAHLNMRFKQGNLNSLERRIYERKTNSLLDPNELLAWGLTNAETQEYLASIQDKSGKSFFSKLLDILAKYFGLRGAEGSALARLMTISEDIFSEDLQQYVNEANKQQKSFGKQANTTGFPSWALSFDTPPVWVEGDVALARGVSMIGKPIYVAIKNTPAGPRQTQVDIRSYNGTAFTPAELTKLRAVADSFNTQSSPRLVSQADEAVSNQIDMIGEKADRTFLGDVNAQLGANKALGIRVKLTDDLAALDDAFTKMYAGKVRDNQGNLNPMVLVSRAKDALRVSKAVQEEGGLYRDPSGLLMAGELVAPEQFNLIAGQKVSYQKVLEKIAVEARSQGKSYEEVRKVVDNILYGHREYYLREKAREMENLAQVLEARGRNSEAADIRAKIPDLMPDADIDAAEQQFRANVGIQEISQMLDAIRFNLIDSMVSAGRLSTEQAQDWKDATAYIPFNRIGEFEQAYRETPFGRNRGIAALKNIKPFKGSEKQSTSVIENFSGLVDYMTREAMKNDGAIRALKDMALMNMAARIPTRQAVSTEQKGAIVDVYDNGERAHYYVPDPAHFVAFNLQDPQVSSFVKAAQKASKVLRAGVTAMPPFAVKQIFDDIVRAYVYSGVENPLALTKNILLNFPITFVSEFTGRKSPVVKELERLGVVGTFDFAESGNLNYILEEAGAQKRGLGTRLLQYMEAAAKASDLAVRKAIYEQTLKETGDKAIAESRAREIINFSRRGSANAINTLVRVIPFFNAYARGMDKLAVAAAGKSVGLSTGQARSMFYKRMLVLTGMGFAYALAMSDDEEYQNLPDHVRDTNWILPFGRELGFVPAIPVPAELAFFFKAIPERIVQYFKLHGSDEERAILDIVKELTVRGVDVFSSPNITPQVLKPIVENMVNYSFFLGRPLESQSQITNLRPYMRYGTGTSELAKLLGSGLETTAQTTGVDLFAISPIKIENFIRGMLGTAAGITLSLSDALINPTRTDRPLYQQLGAQLTGASAVMKDVVGTRFIDEIYNLEKLTSQTYGTLNKLMETDPERIPDFIDRYEGILEVRPQVEAIMNQIKLLNDAALTIDRDTQTSPEEKRKLIDELRIIQNEIAREVYSLKKQAREIRAV